VKFSACFSAFIVVVAAVCLNIDFNAFELLPFKEDNDDFEEIMDNDAGEDLLLQKLAEQSEALPDNADDDSQDDDDEQEGSSRKCYECRKSMKTESILLNDKQRGENNFEKLQCKKLKIV